ncbi:hypothetical protein H109_07362 [Trichophyton interdigitale MR816]|uniref:DNA/RNA-binding domain-containing protein n=1 Tax=Trichophyton interdigitale (strain MR816) TaxID=1215338 RepID=A0A059IYL2_TRIIM|nr:hypothetical protein H109_07362 [Trichophyton interdigitale MR816]
MVRVDLDHRQRHHNHRQHRQHRRQQDKNKPAAAQSLRGTSWSSFDKVEQSSPSPSTSPSPSPSASPSPSPSPSASPSPFDSASAPGSVSASRTSGLEEDSLTARSPDASALQNLNLQELTPKARSRRQSKSNLASPRDHHQRQSSQCNNNNTTPKKRPASERDADEDGNGDGKLGGQRGLPSSKRCSHSHLHTVERGGVFFQTRPATADDGFIDQAIDDDELEDEEDDGIDEQAGGEGEDAGGHADSLPHSIPCSPDLFLQPETRQIAEDQLIVEVQGIYSGLVVVEKKCVEIDTQQLNSRTELSNDQWKALIAIHRTLLHEHHDFFLASQHPSATERLRKLATEYGMPARMWRHGVHSFLELLRHRLPGSLEHMISFIYTAYSMMTLLLESVPAFSHIWIECLGDLARYQMAVEEVDLQNRENWAEVARYWYRMAADKGPNVGRIQHHSAVLARPYILAQLFYYTKSLVCVEPFASSRESILLLFNPLLEEEQQQQQQQQKLHKHIRPKQQTRHPLTLASFVKAHGIMFKKESVHSYFEHTLQFFSCLPQHVGRMGEKFREQGVHISCSNFATLFINDNALVPATGKTLTALYTTAIATPVECRIPSARAYWSTCTQTEPLVSLLNTIPTSSSTRFSSSLSPLHYTIYQSMHTFSLLLRQIGDKNVLPAIHVSLAFLFTLSLAPEAMLVFEPLVPFRDLVTFLNTLNRHRVSESKIASDEFPLPESRDVGVKYHLPEDFDLRGLTWTRLYFPDGHFVNAELPEDEERMLELSHTAFVRAERCLWLGCRLASMDRWFTYDSSQRRFKIKDLVPQLERCSERVPFFRKAAEVLSEATA